MQKWSLHYIFVLMPFCISMNYINWNFLLENHSLLFCYSARLRAVPLQSVESKLGTKWPGGKPQLPLAFLFFTFARFARFPRSRDHSEGLPAVYIQLTWDQVYFRFAFKITFRRARRNEQVSLNWLKVTIYPQTENITLISFISINFIRKITLRIVHILESLETPHMLFITLKH